MFNGRGNKGREMTRRITIKRNKSDLYVDHQKRSQTSSQDGYISPEVAKINEQDPNDIANVKANEDRGEEGHEQVDFARLLSQRFGSCEKAHRHRDCSQSSDRSDQKNLCEGSSSNDSQMVGNIKSSRALEENYDSDNEVIESKVRGRHQQQDANLRIKNLERILTSRKDLTVSMRRKLQSRKNTAIFREKQKNARQLAIFLEYELDAIQKNVSANQSTKRIQKSIKVSCSQLN